MLTAVGLSPERPRVRIICERTT